jgi:RNA polymerase sigma-70 factor, ECF subfamily
MCAKIRNRVAVMTLNKMASNPSSNQWRNSSYSEKSLSELVEGFVADDSAAFTELVKRYQRNIYYLGYRILGNHLDADEVVQECFVRLFRRRKEIANVASFTSFLLRIATNYAIDLLRKKKGHGELGDESGGFPSEEQIELSKRVPTPGELFENKVIMKEIQVALEKLPPKQRITVILHDVNGYSKTEVAEMLSCPEATVRSNLHIGRNKLKKFLTKSLGARE